MMRQPYLSVVVPAYNCAPKLARSLDALVRSALPRSEWELIVADDGSTDDTSATACRNADRVVRVADGPRGPARARNEGAREATGEVLVFIDADVCVSATALAQFAVLFRECPDLGAAFGAYDVSPEAPGIVSQYRNLLHHYLHATSAGPAITFWAGCGAIRRAAFVAAGGFDAERYRRPQIEDIELGYRLSALGYPILLRPEIQGTHLKRWTVRGGMITDVRDRGVPWMELLLERRELASAGPLNLRLREKWLTLLAPLAVVTAVGAALSGSPAVAGLALLAVLLLALANLALFRWFVKLRGWKFTVAIVPLRLSYYLLNAIAATWAILGRAVRHGRGGASSLAASHTPS